MIDAGTGRVAYLLLSHGGFLGLGEEWVPVPVQALAWSDSQGGYTLKGGLQEAKQREALQKGNVPAQVRRAQLEALYRSYGVTPYWQQQG